MQLGVTSKLQTLFDAERTARRLHAELVRDDGSAHPWLRLKHEVSTVQARAVGERRRRGGAAPVRLAALLGGTSTAGGGRLLIDILACDEPEARHAAGERFEDWRSIGSRRSRSASSGRSSGCPSGSPALSELPGHARRGARAGGAQLLGSFLKHTVSGGGRRPPSRPSSKWAIRRRQRCSRRSRRTPVRCSSRTRTVRKPRCHRRSRGRGAAVLVEPQSTAPLTT